jgi:ATP-dependent helicase HepA
LADEVGLGKTIQALMIINALKDQRPSLNVLIVVPDRLVTQWRDEIMTRAHTAPVEEQSSGQQYIRLAWEARLGKVEEQSSWTLADIDSSKYDVLVVDEMHRLRSDVQDRIVREAPFFEHLLVLTATPAFQRPERHAQIFAMLEPEITSLARLQISSSTRGKDANLSVDDDLSRWPEWAAIELVQKIKEKESSAESAISDVDDPSNQLLSAANSVYRRVIRTRRTDYKGVLPNRRHIRIVAEPLEAESDRQALMWDYCADLGDLSRRFYHLLLA